MRHDGKGLEARRLFKPTLLDESKEFDYESKKNSFNPRNNNSVSTQ